MKMILKIAKKEWMQLFFSPIAWLLLVAFIVQTSLIFIHRYMSMVDASAYHSGYSAMTHYIFSNVNVSAMRAGTGGLWINIQDFLFLYIPLLTMGIVSREIANGSIKLMYSSPLRNSQIILGKFLALVGYAAVMMAPLLFYVLFSYATIGVFDLPWALTGLLGLFLLACTYMAIGIFVSSLTHHQAIAAVGTFLLFTFLSVVGGMWQQYDWMREFAYWLSLKGRVTTFIHGLLCSEDLIYFPLICAAFLTLTVIRLNSVRQKLSAGLTACRYVGVVAVLFAVGGLSCVPQLMCFWDTTADQHNSLLPKSQEVMKAIDEKVTITSYVNILDYLYNNDLAYPGFIMRNRKEFEGYVRFKPDMKVKTVYYYAMETPELNMRFANDFPEASEKELTLKFCMKNGIDPGILKSKEDLDPNVGLKEAGYPTVRVFRTESGKQAFYTNMYRSSIYDEPEVIATFKRLVTGAPQIGFVQGHRERRLDSKEPLEYQTVLNGKREKRALCNNGFDIREITLDQSVPEDISIVMLADPREEIPAAHEKVLEEYIARGGNLILLGEPRRRDIFNPVLRRLLGVEVTPQVVFAGDAATPQNKLKVLFQTEDIKALNMKRLVLSERMMLQAAGGIDVVEDRGFQTYVLTHTDPKVSHWTELETTDLSDEKAEYNPAAGEEERVFNTMIALSREVNGKQQKILVAGDTDLFNNENQASGCHVMHGITNWMTDGEFPLFMPRPREQNTKVSLTPDQFGVIQWAFSVVLPLLLAIGGCFLWFRRKAR